MNKFEFVGRLIAEDSPAQRTLLDVGCRTCDLRPYLPPGVSYHGLDLYQNDAQTVEFVLDIEQGLPMADASFDYVVALDVLEHLNDLHGALLELNRVARRRLIIMLPNIAHVFFRKNFLLHGQINGKYVLKYGGGQDRHRWLTVLPETNEFFRRFAAEHSLGLEVTLFNDSRKKRLLERTGRLLGVPPIWWAWATCYDLRKEASVDSNETTAGGDTPQRREDSF